MLTTLHDCWFFPKVPWPGRAVWGLHCMRLLWTRVATMIKPCRLALLMLKLPGSRLEPAVPGWDSQEP